MAGEFGGRVQQPQQGAGFQGLHQDTCASGGEYELQLELDVFGL